jgi:hypothetical protein
MNSKVIGILYIFHGLLKIYQNGFSFTGCTKQKGFDSVLVGRIQEAKKLTHTLKYKKL